MTGYQTINLRGELPRNAKGGPGWRVASGEKRGLVIHYFGPAIPASQSDRAVIFGAANYHLTKDWDEDPRNGLALAGDGLMYHVVIGRDGARYRTRDPDEVLWHCGAWPQNAIALAVLVLVGGDDRATTAQLGSLSQLCDEWREQTGTTRGEIWGHQELSWTSCPGTLMRDFVLPYRAGWPIGEGKRMADGHWFQETGHYIGGAFWDYWQGKGGLPIFGYPLTDELREDGRTVQYFERAVFEWHPENHAPFKVLLRRLGAAALEMRG